MAIVCVLTYPVVLLPVRRSLERWWTQIYWRGYQQMWVNSSSMTDSHELISLTTNLRDNTSNDKRDAMVRLVLSTLLVLVTSAVTYSSPWLSDLISFLRSCTVTLVCFILPPLFHFRYASWYFEAWLSQIEAMNNTELLQVAGSRRRSMLG